MKLQILNLAIVLASIVLFRHWLGMTGIVVAFILAQLVLNVLYFRFVWMRLDVRSAEIDLNRIPEENR